MGHRLTAAGSLHVITAMPVDSLLITGHVCVVVVVCVCVCVSVSVRARAWPRAWPAGAWPHVRVHVRAPAVKLRASVFAS